MAIFRDLSQQSSSGRAARDRARHRTLVREALRRSLPDVITDEAIIGSAGSKKIKIPILGKKEYRFVYGSENSGVGQGEGVNPGDSIGKGKGRPQPGMGGDEAGEIVIELELSLEEVFDLLFEDLELPFLERKKFHEIEHERHGKLQGQRPHGSSHRLDIEASYVERLRRMQARKRELLERAAAIEHDDPVEAERLREEAHKKAAFDENDLRYRTVTTEIERKSNAVVFFIMDVSVSMDRFKRYLVKSFDLLLYRFLKTKYRRVEYVFIGHHTEAFETNEYDFFHLSDSGGTFISTGPLEALRIIKERYPVDLWNIYAVHCSDGENYSNDNDAAIRAFQELLTVANLVGFIEVRGMFHPTMGEILEDHIKEEHFTVIRIESKEEVLPAFQKFMNADKEGIANG